MSASSRSPARWAVPASLIVLCLAVYANSFSTGFALDNRQLILNDPRVHAATLENLWLIVRHTYWWPYGESGLYRPLTTLSYLFNFAILGNADHPAGYHWFNLLVHMANVLLFWRLVTRLTRDTWIAAVAAMLWAVSPLSTEAVTNIVGRADVMAGTSVLLCTLAALRLIRPGDERPATESRGRSAAWLLAIAVALMAGVLSKESAVAVLGVLVVAALLWRRWTDTLKGLLGIAAVVVIPVGAWLWLRTSVLAAGGVAEFPFTDNPIVGGTFWQARLTAIRVMWRYVLLFAWPAHLSNDYSYPQIPLAVGSLRDWIGVLLLVGGTLGALWQVRRNKPVVFFAAFAFVLFLPASNLLFASGTIMGERLMYLPSAGLTALIAIGLHTLGSDSRRHLAVSLVAALLVAAWGARTVVRNPDWTNDITLWRSAAASAPASAKAHRALAEALYDSDPTHANIDEVIASADRSVALLEPLEDEQNSFQAFRQAGAYYLDKANRLPPGSEASPNPELPRIYSRALHLLDRAVVIARNGARAAHGSSALPEADAQRLRAAALLGLKNPPLALNAANRSRELQPLHPLAYRLAAASLLQLHRDDEAAMMLLTGSIVSGDGGLGQEVMTLYRNGLDTEGCAVIGAGTAATLNPACAIVARQSCVASAAAYQILTKGGFAEPAAQIRRSAVEGIGCPADLMDRPNSLVR